MRTTSPALPASGPIAAPNFQGDGTLATSSIATPPARRRAPRSLNAASFTPNKERFRNEIPLRDAALARIFDDTESRRDYKEVTAVYKPEATAFLDKLNNRKYPDIDKLSPIAAVRVLRDLSPERILAIDARKPAYLPSLLVKAGFSDEPIEISGVETSHLKIALDRLKEFGGKASESSSAEHIWANETGIRARLLYTLALREVSFSLDEAH